MHLVPVIGLETHIQLQTKSKLFCSCPTNAEHTPANTNVCPVCLAHPGTLPTLNEQAVRYAILLGLALGGTIAEKSKFDRKNYFYPDLPKAYQISQYDQPIMTEGHIALEVPGTDKVTMIGIERMHLEEDAAKNIHADDGSTYVDFNRASVALCEIVTKPDFTSAIEAKAYLQELRLLVRTLGVSGGDMEKGQLRCDVNISLREVAPDGTLGPLNPKTEIKNINSFRHVERAIAFEIERQTKLWEAGTPPTVTTTRGWNDATQSTEEQRVKEGQADYRFFPEPDVPPLDLVSITEEIRHSLPELPAKKRVRFVHEYGLKQEDARQIVDDPALANFAEAAYSELGAWLEAKPDVTPETMPEVRAKLAKTFSSWLITKLTGLLADRSIDVRIMKLTPENFAEFITMIADGRITTAKGLEVLGAMLDSGADPEHVISDMGATRLDDVVALRQIVETVVAEHPNEAARFRNGETKLLQFFLGLTMKETKGNADPALTAQTIQEVLQ